ncbi:hypothetical protein GJ744_011827 [Endocarpon pusillum]|uniref:Uncharacterized protein n=1 Tax=Endocarpon pusillum TaxID=364733 RepID=A0A8H7AFY1_9EURO|nr:hypothetical protein GJ744_011827 [Endocarpon pusillum]
MRSPARLAGLSHVIGVHTYLSSIFYGMSLATSSDSARWEVLACCRPSLACYSMRKGKAAGIMLLRLGPLTIPVLQLA